MILNQLVLWYQLFNLYLYFIFESQKLLMPNKFKAAVFKQIRGLLLTKQYVKQYFQ